MNVSTGTLPGSPMEEDRDDRELEDDMMMAPLDPKRRGKIDDRAAALIAEVMTLRDLRKARKAYSGPNSQDGR